VSLRNSSFINSKSQIEIISTVQAEQVALAAGLSALAAHNRRLRQNTLPQAQLLL
jgi:hypothetical protein